MKKNAKMYNAHNASCKIITGSLRYMIYKHFTKVFLLFAINFINAMLGRDCFAYKLFAKLALVSNVQAYIAKILRK